MMTRNGDGDDVAPPAYSDDGTYANLQRDVKAPVVMAPPDRTGGAGMSGPVAAPAPAPAPAPVAAVSTSTTAPAPTAATAPQQRQAAEGKQAKRPISSYTIYDPDDAYGGM